MLGAIVSAAQFQLFDCSGLPALSFGAGFLTVALAMVVIDRVYVVSVSTRPANSRIAIAAGIDVIGAGIVSRSDGSQWRRTSAASDRICRAEGRVAFANTDLAAWRIVLLVWREVASPARLTRGAGSGLQFSQAVRPS